MAHPPSPDSLVTTIRALAERGEWTGVHERLLGRDAEVAAQPEIALLLGEAELRLGAAHAAEVRLREVIPALESRVGRLAHRRAINLLGAAQFELGDLDAAEDSWDRTLEMATTDHDDLLVARATNNLGAIANIRGRRAVALSLYQLAIPAYQRLGAPIGIAQSYHNMAITFRQMGQLDAADEYELRVIEYARQAGDSRLVALARLGRAEVALQRGDARLAEQGARLAADLFASIPDPVREADAMHLVGMACTATGNLAEAGTALDAAVSLAQTHGSPLIEAESLQARAELSLAAGALDRARTDATRALELYTRLGAADERAAVERLLARLDAGD